ncbi:MAG: hypothetical protein ACTHZX_09990 [Microbacterium sp.]
MSRTLSWILAVVVLALGAIVGVILSNVWLGLLIGAIIAIVIVIGAQSRRGRNQGVNDEDHGIEL